MNRISDKKAVSRVALLFAITYTVSHITRINYGAVISEMERDTGISKSLLSMAVTGSFITYGVGQVISGLIGDRLSPKKIITCGFAITTCMNLLVPLYANPYYMLAVWCVNGFAQSLMWPPLVRLMTSFLSDEDYKMTASKVSLGGNFGTIVVYLVSPLLITLFSWRAVFVFSGICGILMIVYWQKCAPDAETERHAHERRERRSNAVRSGFPMLLVGVATVIMLQGMLRDGVTTWVPSYISETYRLSSSISILTGVLLPVFGIICIRVTTRLYVKRFENPLACAGVIFLVGAVSAFALCCTGGKNAALSVLFSAALIGCIHGVNFILTSMIPPYFKNGGNVSAVSGILNSCTYVGSAISTYGIAAVSEHSGWGITLLVWLLIAVLGSSLCLAISVPWKRKFED